MFKLKHRERYVLTKTEYYPKYPDNFFLQISFRSLQQDMIYETIKNRVTSLRFN